MLTQLRLENYAVIDSAEVEFSSGLNLLTGETGAGKSILIDALALLLGEKASAEVVRAGADRATVSCVFTLEDSVERIISEIFEANGLDHAEGSVIFRREITAAGKGRVFVNNQPATVAVLKQLAPHLATIHAQSESLAGFDAASRLALLDIFAGTDFSGVECSFQLWRETAAKIDELERDEQERLHLLDLWKFQKNELDLAALKPGEDEALESEKRVLANAEKIYSAAVGAFDLLYEGENSASSSLRSAQKRVNELMQFEPKFGEALAALETARISIEDVGATLRDYAGGIQASPEHLAEIEDRLAGIGRLKRKYGATVAEMIELSSELGRKVEAMENKDETLAHLRRERAQRASDYRREAELVSKRRQDVAKKLEKRTEEEINDLAMKSSFRIQVQPIESEANWTARGFDEAQYLVSANPGEPLRPMESVASGGELSRIMLALKASVETGASSKKNSKAAQRTLLFDEIDIGIGGRAAEAVGKKLKALSRSNQVLCVTHLPQIAAFADHHYVIEKKVSAGRTRTAVREISGSERTEELARMLSGARVTETSLKHAEQMLKVSA